MAERRPVRIEPRSIAGAVLLGVLWVGLGCVTIVVLAAELFGGGGLVTRTAELTAGLALALGLLAAVVTLRVDLVPELRRLAGTALRGESVSATAQLGALAGRLAGYPRRFGRRFGLVLLPLIPAALALAAALLGTLDDFLLPMLPAAALTAPTIGSAVRFTTRRALRPLLAVLPAPPSPSAFRGGLGSSVSGMLLLPAGVAALLGLVYVPLESAARDERAWRAAHARAAAAVAEAPTAAALASPGRDPGERGAARVACGAPGASSADGGLAARACLAARSAGRSETGGSWIEGRRVFAAAALPAPASGSPGAVVVWSPLPAPAVVPPWLLLALLLLFAGAQLGGAALGAALGRSLRPVASVISRAGKLPGGTAAVPPVRTRVKEIARLDEAAREMGERLDAMRGDEEEAIEKLREAQRLRTQFLASVSHDLKGPLNAILGFSELLLQGVEGPLARKQREGVRLVYRAGEDLLRIINSILDSAKLEAGRIELHREWMPSVELFSEAVRQAREFVGGKDVTVQMQVQAGLPPLHVDPHRIQQALNGVVNNAVKFMECGVVTVRARIDSGPPLHRRALRIDVLDQGPGISDDDRSRIFRAFEQVDSSTARTADGPGLGLFIARSMIELHGGRIWFETEVGRGSVFSIVLPLPDEEPTAGA